MKVNFDAFRYYPSLRSRMWEMRGYSELGDADKDQLLPIIVLASHLKTRAVAEISAKVDEYLQGRSRILDLELSSVYACDECDALRDPSNGFQAWREFVGRQDLAVPTALIPSGAPLRDVVRQVIQLEAAGKQVVVRSRAPQTELPILMAIMSAVDTVDSLLIVLDFGYVRSRAKARAIEAANVINALRDVDDAA